MFRKGLKITMMALGVVAGGLLTSCSMDNEPSNGNSGIKLAKAPDMMAYSGKHVWGSTSATRGTDMNANEWDQRWDCPPRPAEDLTDAELAELKDLLSKGSEIHNTLVLPFENYYVQQIYKGTDTYHSIDHCAREAYDGSHEIKCGGNNYCEHLTTGDHTNNDNILGSDHMDKLVAYDGNPYTTQWDPTLGQNVSYPYGHVNNFNSGTNGNYPDACGCGEVHYKTTLMTNMPTTGFGPEEQFGFHETFGTNHDYFNYYIVEYKGYWYVGFDYEAHKYDQNTNNHGEAMDVNRDWNFTDWIVRITPAYAKGTTPEGNPGGVTDPTEPETPEVPGGGDVIIPDNPIIPFPGYYGVCIECGHEHEMGVECPECQEDDHVCVGPEEKPGFVKGEDEVEINLAVDKKNHDLLESHLSMHVRSATDVEVFIPVPAEYYCAADDMDIVLNHGNFVHGGPIKTEYKIGENTVSLNVEFLDGGIRIWTDGITEEVINYCRENYQDGITFEVWNYFNDPETGNPYLSMEELKEYLDQATVRFIDKLPGAYINAFGKDNGKYGSDNPDGKDFHVVPDEEYSDDFEDPVDGPHYNGSDNNEIYKKK